ncbi:sugar phosphate nucleotidyltransferase [Terribacillus saccharophilus]|uniref:sugar phosphate nucleotidyltransferase n=1 Tax=Terribacillus saccharophilus TaxID=361277 RepID=UPI000C9A7953|nr:sugar phosphate nucleotidyltransferase [Terribacillus goriensis]MEC0282051.1 sugar phosphate nucleotidyltransferase [Terribacillus saccharophilus]MEC0291160.1 sugar phosphate nucleotidyltransferase [Terribacillus saccharophilus]
MRLVLLSGGSGKRLWPLSNDSRSKQFLKVLRDDEDKSQSMVQRVWKQLEQVGLADKSIIATSAAQVDMIKSQLGESVPLVIEPERRDTFAAIALASSYLHSIEKCDINETVCILPVDPYVNTDFFNVVKNMDQILEDTRSDISLIGVKPTFPSEKYGYIVPKSNNGDTYAVEKFKEKPNQEVAKELIDKGALWNCGVFSFKIGYLLEILKNKGIQQNYDDLKENYKSLPKNSFDYEVVERANKVTVLPYSGSWKDLGTWNTLTEEMAEDITGKGVISHNTLNSHIVNELDIPVTLLGINNAIVAVSPDGILVSNKDASPQIKEYIKEFNGRPMYEERRWGWYRVLDYKKYEEGNEVLTKRIGIDAGKNLSYQVHYKRSEVWTIVKGEGILILNEKLSHVRAGDVIKIPLSMKHSIKAITDLEIIEVQSGLELVEEDIHRITASWDVILENINKIQYS